MSATPAQAAVFHWQQGWRYGLMGLPLAFVALPLYVLLPNHYARSFGVPLAILGVLLLVARLFDAIIDPLLGRWSDRLFARSPAVVLRWGGVAACVLASGFVALFFPPVRSLQALLAWAAIALAVTYAAFSALSVMHQSWGAMLGGDEARRSRVVAWREGLGLVGIVLASISPVALGFPATTALFFIALLVAWLAWRTAPQPAAALAGATGQRVQGTPVQPGLDLPFTRPAFRALLAVFVVNGIASAVPATLLLFFVQDRLQAAASWEPLFLGSYFVCAALAIPLWLRLARHIGLARAWGVGMLLAIAVFVFALGLGAGDNTAFLLVCALSGAALGTDLVLPSALLAGTIADSGDRGRAEGAYFGWWNFASKFNLALAAGVALPALATLGYVPGTRDPQALHTLSLAYCLLPCALKLLAAALLYFLILRKPLRP
ncbi:MAG: MFS transporter [Pseudomonadota bacterium]